LLPAGRTLTPLVQRKQQQLPLGAYTLVESDDNAESDGQGQSELTSAEGPSDERLTFTKHDQQTRNTVMLEDDDRADTFNAALETGMYAMEQPHGFLDLLQQAIEQREKEHTKRTRRDSDDEAVEHV